MNNLNITDSLIKAGPQLNIQDKNGLTPLHYGNPFDFIKFSNISKI